MTGIGHHALDLTGPAGDLASPVHRLDPRAKIAGLVGVTLVAVTTPIAAWPVYAACAGALAAVAIVARVGPGVIWRRARVVLPLVLFVAVFVPFVHGGGPSHDLGPVSVSGEGLAILGAVAAKATIGTVSAVLLAATTSFPAVLRGLAALRVPRLFTLIAALMYRYLFVIVEEVQRMRTALAARAYRPRHALQAGPIGNAATALFLRTYGRGERVHMAMLARGYRGRMRSLEPLSFRAIDGVFVTVLIGSVVAVRVLVGVAA
jgi:cobalt/nickel transport system permease protein